MRVVFLKTVPNVATAGDVKEVKDGYARNYLLPQKIAAPATPDQLRRVDALKKAEEERQLKVLRDLQTLAQRLEGLAVTVKARVGEKEQLYGSVTNGDIAQEIAKVIEVEIDRRAVELVEPIKQLGTYEVPVRVAQDLVPKVKVSVEPLEA